MTDRDILNWLQLNCVAIHRNYHEHLPHRPVTVEWVDNDGCHVTTSGADLADAVRGAVIREID